jgi:hypothetical protein
MLHIDRITFRQLRNKENAVVFNHHAYSSQQSTLGNILTSGGGAVFHGGDFRRKILSLPGFCG